MKEVTVDVETAREHELEVVSEDRNEFLKSHDKMLMRGSGRSECGVARNEAT